MNDVAAEVRDILVFHLGADERRLTDDARLSEDLGADSLDVVEIVMSCEERFAIEIPNRVATRLATVGDTVRFIESRIGQLLARIPRTLASDGVMPNCCRNARAKVEMSRHPRHKQSRRQSTGMACIGLPAMHPGETWPVHSATASSLAFEELRM